MTHDYKRNRIATLFAALSTLDGTAISMCDDRRRNQERLRFLSVTDDVTPPDKELHPLHAGQRYVAQHGRAPLPRSHRRGPLELDGHAGGREDGKQVAVLHKDLGGGGVPAFNRVQARFFRLVTFSTWN